jgi:hypothetical protein
LGFSGSGAEQNSPGCLGMSVGIVSQTSNLQYVAANMELNHPTPPPWCVGIAERLVFCTRKTGFKPPLHRPPESGHPRPQQAMSGKPVRSTQMDAMAKRLDPGRRIDLAFIPPQTDALNDSCGFALPTIF